MCVILHLFDGAYIDGLLCDKKEGADENRSQNGPVQGQFSGRNRDVADEGAEGAENEHGCHKHPGSALGVLHGNHFLSEMVLIVPEDGAVCKMYLIRSGPKNISKMRIIPIDK